MKQEISVYSSCKICRFYLSDFCEPCLAEITQTRFEMRQGLTFEDLPPFPTPDFNDGMPVKMRQAIVGAYMEMIVRKLQEEKWTRL